MSREAPRKGALVNLRIAVPVDGSAASGPYIHHWAELRRAVDAGVKS